MFAHFARRDNKSKIIIKSFPGGEVLKEFAIPEGHFAGRDVAWTKSNFVLYVAEDNNLVGNLWQQSLDGSAPERLTNYNTEGIFFFDYSPESSRLALIRGSWRSDLVLLTGLSR